MLSTVSVSPSPPQPRLSLSRLVTKCGCAPSEDSDQPGYPPSLIRVFAVRSMGKGPSFLHVDSEDSDQPGRMPRLI